jgi:hypothetical protein
MDVEELGLGEHDEE